MFASLKSGVARNMGVIGLGAASYALAAALLFPTADAQSRYADMTPEEREAFRGEVRAFLLEEPEIIVEALDVLEERLKERGVAELAKEVADGLVVAEDGAPDGTLLMVEFTDYDCPWCRRVRPEVDAFLAASPDVRYVVLPLARVRSDIPERAVIAARMQSSEQALKLHNEMMVFEGALDLETVLLLADGVGLDVEKLRTEMGGEDVSAFMARVEAAARRLNISGTPGFVLGNEIIPGAVPAEELTRVAAEQRAKK